MFSAEISLFTTCPCALFCYCLLMPLYKLGRRVSLSLSSSAREQVSNSTLVCSPAGHIMKWPNSDDSTWEGVRNCSAVCRNASCDDGEPGGDPHPFPCAAHGAELACSQLAGEDSAQAAGEFKTAMCAPRQWLRSHGWLVALVQDKLLRPAAVLALI